MAYTLGQIKEIFSNIIERIENGEALRTILKDKGMPSSQTIYKWLREDEEKSKQYEDACNKRADAIFDEMFEIADDGSNDWIERHTKAGDTYYELNGEHVQRSRLRIDTRKWALSKMNPKKFGDQSKLTLEGGINVTNKQDYSEYSTEDLELIANISKKYEKKKD